MNANPYFATYAADAHRAQLMNDARRARLARPAKRSTAVSTSTTHGLLRRAFGRPRLTVRGARVVGTH